MNYQLKILLFTFLLCMIGCSEIEYDVTANVYKWESDGLMHTTYFYEVENLSKEDLSVICTIEATCEDGTVYSDEAWIDVSSGKKRKSSTFFNTDGKMPDKIEVVDISSRKDPF